MNAQRCLIALTTTVALAACGDAEPVTTFEAPEPTRIDGTPTPWTPPDVPSGLSVEAARPRRLSVEQVERSVEVIAELPEGSFVLPVSLSYPMGRPDFRSVTATNNEPSPLFMKLMVDIGAFVCGYILGEDAERPLPLRMLAPTDDLDTNLRGIWIRFTAISGPEADADIERLRTVYNDASDAGGSEAAGYLAACVAAATSSEFLLY